MKAVKKIPVKKTLAVWRYPIGWANGRDVYAAIFDQSIEEVREKYRWANDTLPLSLRQAPMSVKMVEVLDADHEARLIEQESEFVEDWKKETN